MHRLIELQIDIDDLEIMVVLIDMYIDRSIYIDVEAARSIRTMINQEIPYQYSGQIDC